MKKFFNILNRKLTLGTVFTIIATFIFAFVVRHSYLYLFDFLPVRGELEALDISYFCIVVGFKFVFSAFLEYLLNDKFSIPLFEAIGKGVGQKGVTTLSMEDNDPKVSFVENSSKGKNTVAKEDSGSEKTPRLRHEEYKLGDKMGDVLEEQKIKIRRLHTMRLWKDVKFYEIDGSLEITVPTSMTDAEAEKLSKEVGALDRSLQNKFSEYRNLSGKDSRLYKSVWTSIHKPVWEGNQERYKELFEKKKTT